MGIKDIAAKAKEKMTGGDNSAVDRGVDEMGDRFDDATGGKYAEQTDRAQEATNERLDDYLGGDSSRRNREPGM